MTGRPFTGVPSEVRSDIPPYLTEPAGEGGDHRLPIERKAEA